MGTEPRHRPRSICPLYAEELVIARAPCNVSGMRARAGTFHFTFVPEHLFSANSTAARAIKNLDALQDN